MRRTNFEMAEIKQKMRNASERRRNAAVELKSPHATWDEAHAIDTEMALLSRWAQKLRPSNP